MNDESRKRLTEYLGKKWIEPDLVVTCFDSYNRNSTFNTYSDLGTLKDKLVENGEWDYFLEYTVPKGNSTYLGPSIFYDAEAIDWLFRPESCELVDEYLKSKEGSRWK